MIEEHIAQHAHAVLQTQPTRPLARVAGPRAAQQRSFHPLVWPVWTLAAGVAVSANPLHNLVLLTAVTLVASACHSDGPVGRSFGLFVRFGLVLLVMRVVLSCIAVGGFAYGVTTLGVLPQVTLPRWASGIALGGRFTLEMLLNGVTGGVRWWAVLLVFGAFNATADQYALLRRTPHALYGAGLVVTIALAWVPQMIVHFQAVREAQQVRGLRRRGLRAALPLAVPMLIGGLERAVFLAEAMDSRGYGYAVAPNRHGLKQQLLLLLGIVGVALGLYATLGYRQWALWGVGAMGVGSILLAGALQALGRGIHVTRYTREHWRQADQLVVAAALVIVIGLALVRILAPMTIAYAIGERWSLPPFSPLVGALTLLLTTPALLQGRSDNL